MAETWWTHEWEGAQPPPTTRHHADGSVSRTFDPGVGREVTGVRVREEVGPGGRRTRVAYRYGDAKRHARFRTRPHGPRWIAGVIGEGGLLCIAAYAIALLGIGAGPIAALLGYVGLATWIWCRHRDPGPGLWRRIAEVGSAAWVAAVALGTMLVGLWLADVAGVLTAALLVSWWLNV